MQKMRPTTEPPQDKQQPLNSSIQTQTQFKHTDTEGIKVYFFIKTKGRGRETNGGM